MKRPLGKDDLKILSGILGIENDILIGLSDKDLLKHSQAKALLIKTEYDRLVQEGKNKKCRIMADLATKYGVSKSYIEIFIYNKVNGKSYYCSCCGRKISLYQSKKNSGKCNICTNKND
ncbi:hypothetical protein [Dysgonomonas sp. 520]|uniref:hypothetical protein n=1 Tax=Dysgonomonas sp. 520 TaxID=2302931 RepID=UPI0013CFD949|nr:hypothetical protein [Dysgonomonas sp. 520]NDW08748.1 hypothetical protein [Dysgonomonas sp. 520]